MSETKTPFEYQFTQEQLLQLCNTFYVQKRHVGTPDAESLDWALGKVLGPINLSLFYVKDNHGTIGIAGGTDVRWSDIEKRIKLCFKAHSGGCLSNMYIGRSDRTIRQVPANCHWSREDKDGLDLKQLQEFKELMMKDPDVSRIIKFNE